MRVPTVLQLEATECGAACLAMVLARNGAWVPLEELRVACGVSRDGANALSVVRAARQYGMTAKGMKRELAQLRDEPFPVVVFWGFDHFVVVEGIHRQGLQVNDPALGRRVATWDEVDRLFTGVVLRMEPADGFVRRGRPPSAVRGLLPFVSGSWLGVLFMSLAGLALAVPALAVPLVPKLFIDIVIGQGETPAAGWLALVLLVSVVMQLYLLGLQQVVAVRFNTKLGLLLGDRLVGHALRLPQRFFEQRYAGDVAYRVTLAGEVAATLSGQVAPALLGVVTSVLYLAVLAVLSPLLAVIAAGAGVIDALAVWFVRRRQEESSRRSVREQAMFNGAVSYGLQTMETVKATGSEADLFATVTGVQARALSAWADAQRPTVVLAAVPVFVAQAATLVVLGAGAFLALSGFLSVGSLLAATLALSGFLAPIGTVVTLGSTMQLLRGNLERIDDLLDQDPDPVFSAPRSTAPRSTAPRSTAPSQRPVPPEVSRLRGDLDLRGVTFGYSRTAGPLLHGLDLRIRPGSRVAVVGRSGSGKSTVAKLASGLLQPWEGQVRLDGRPYLDWPRELVTASLAHVTQEITFFRASVRDNLTLWDRSIPDEDVLAAARDACIEREVLARPAGLDTLMDEGGLDWSGGERQRLEIARSLVTAPAILVLDEATSALDPLVELAVDRALRERGCSMLIVAHRLSTVRDCDEILVLDRGRVAERGGHDELVAAGGLYRDLVSAG